MMQCVDLDSDMPLFEELTTTTVLTTVIPTTSGEILNENHRNYIIGASVGVFVFLVIVIALYLIRRRSVNT